MLEGPYGGFDYRLEKKNQIWIGGGVGIASFISWANDLKRLTQPNFNVDLYYCVNTEKEATHLHVFKGLEKQMESFRVNLIRVDVEGFIKPGEIPRISEKEIFICGPREMRKDLFLT